MPQRYTSDRAVLVSGLHDAFPYAPDGDITRLAELVLNAAASAAEAEFRAIMLDVKALNQPKKGMRDPDDKKPMSEEQRVIKRQLVDPTARARATIVALLKRLDGAGDPPPVNRR